MAKQEQTVVIKAPNEQLLRLEIVGNAPLMVHRFWAKAAMQEAQAEGEASRSRKKRDARDYDKEAQNAKHVSRQGWEGVHAGAFRNAMIDACRLAGLQMTKAKLAIFIEADGFDRDEGVPLVRIHGKAITDVRPARNDNGSVALRARPRYDKWSMALTIRYDADLLKASDIVNLLSRVGRQVGIAEGRPFSKESAGIGFGTFDVKQQARKRAAAKK